ncbi:threonine aldolase family protein [Microbulbifer hainanensis]|uniref:threonine aldolase family protein n=1 Tax=Microbulbifer hainanensis TaxID=2735675 RepID=UPI001866B060|nr:beta-eliminating lyase-related protein [Microbulbifer hainanensis]
MTAELIAAYRTAFGACTHSSVRHTPQSLKTTLQQLADAVGDDEQTDVYGGGALIEDFEHEVAELLGKEAAVFMPSGTQAQPIALRLWADRARTPYVALPATSHLQLHEHNAYQVLYGLKGITLGAAAEVPTLADLQQAARDPLAAILLELPMREIGGQLPGWDDLVAQSQWAREQGIKLHLDGARLWQCPPHYGRSLAEIAALFDSVYVSFYKDLGGIAGAVLAGDADFIASAKVWQRRAGGNLYALYPYVIAARQGLATYLPNMTSYRDDARWFAEQLNAVNGVQTWPLEPQTSMFRLRVDADPTEFLPRATAWLAEHDIAVLPPPYRAGEGSLWFELSFGEGFRRRDRADWAGVLERFVADVLGRC